MAEVAAARREVASGTGQTGGGASRPAGRIDVDFSLAMHNRTGKYFIGRDLLDCAAGLIGSVYYWRLRRDEAPSGLFGKLICKLQNGQVRLNAAAGFPGWRPPHPSRRVLLHLEPYTVLTAQLRRQDAVLVHDVGPITHPELFDRKLRAAYVAVFADLARVGPNLIFASRTSQWAFEKLYAGGDPARSRVIYPAIRSDIAPPAPRPVANLDGAFLLTVGSMGDRKNQARCIRAFVRSGLADRGVRYVLCGGTEPGHADVTAQAAGAKGVRLLPYVSDAELAWLYLNCSGFVLASLLEGFGIPLAEAISHGVVPAVSARSVLEEVAGEGALLVDPLDEEDIAAAMVRLIEMPQAERETRLIGLRSAMARFTPEKFCADWQQALHEISVANEG